MFDAESKIEELITEIRDWFEENGPDTSAVLGISGGKDSTVTAALLARALGPDRVVGVLMPNGYQSDIKDSETVLNALGIRSVVINIENAYDALIDSADINHGSNYQYLSEDALINLPPRLRMAVLYMVAQSLPEGGRVINTCNRSEDYVGYSTKFGDCAGDMSVLGNLLVSEILTIGDKLDEIPNELVHKVPSDGLCGKTDEDRFGFTYDQLEKYIVDGTSGDTEIDNKIAKMHNSSRHKYMSMYTLW